MKLLTALLFVCLCGTARADAPVPVAVVPFAPLGGDVPANAGERSAEVLTTTLKSHDGLSVKQAAQASSADPAAAVKKAQADVAKGRQALNQGQPAQAEKAFSQALDALSQGAAAADTDGLADLYAALSRALYQQGKDPQGLAALDHAEALRPGKAFSEVQSSALFAGLAKAEQARVWALPKSELRIDSIPPGATAQIDGLEAGRTPVVVRDLPPGDHLWRVALPSGSAVGGVVEVKAGAKAEVTGAQLAAGPAKQLTAELLTNALTPQSLEAMKTAAAGLDAQWLVFGGLHVDGSDLVLDSFVYSRKAHAFARLPQARFDPDLVSAGQALAKVAGDVSGRAIAGTLGVAAAVPEKVSKTAAAEASDLSRFHYPAPGSLDAPATAHPGHQHPVGGHHGPVRPHR